MQVRTHIVVACALIAACGTAAQAGVPIITPGFTFSVASDGADQTVGHHFHSSTGGEFGNPAGLAEVGNYFSEEVRGLSEYNLAGLVNGPAFVTFDVFQSGGLFPSQNDFPWNGTIHIYAYQGNNQEDIADYQAASIGFVGSFLTNGLVVGAGLSFDITGIFNDALDANWDSLGIRLQPATDPAGGAWVFNNFRLTSEPIPAPGTLALLALSGLAVSRRRR